VSILHFWSYNRKKVVDWRFFEARGVPPLQPERKREDTPMRRVHHDDEARQQQLLDLDEIARQGARKMLAEAVKAEIEFCIEAARGERDENGHALVTRNGYARER
jgi:hypothetical protein